MMLSHLQQWSLPLAVILIPIMLLAPACRRAQSIAIPKDLAGMRILRQLNGAQATELIDHLHGKGVSPQQSLVAFYADASNKATVYVSRYSDVSEAISMKREMAKRIAAGNPVFEAYQELSLGAQQVSRCVGMGQIHFFFVRDADLYWLSANPPLAQQAVDDLLR